jgi:hypothetical protein
MAQTLRESLTTKAINISHSESLELVSKILGARRGLPKCVSLESAH